jgi:hypothetical protein
MAYTKTSLGQTAFTERSELMSARQRSLFLLVNGFRTVDQVLVITKALGSTQADIDHLVSVGFIEEGESITPINPSPAADVVSAAPDSGSASSSLSTPQERFAQAWPMATQLTAGMGLRGFRLNLSIEAASGYEELLALLPKIQAALGNDKCAALERALKA